MPSAPDQISQNQKERLAFLELKLYFSGELRRSDIEARFGVKPAAASRDLALYREWAEQNIEYDNLARCYRPTRVFAPLFPFQPDRVLCWLSQGFGDGLECWRRFKIDHLFRLNFDQGAEAGFLRPGCV